MYTLGKSGDENHLLLNQEGLAQKHAQFYSLQPILAVTDVTATAEFYRDQLGFEIDFLFGDPPDFGQVSQGEWSFERVQIQLSQVDDFASQKPTTALYVQVGPDVDG